jgi:hypothetical protein
MTMRCPEVFDGRQCALTQGHPGAHQSESVDPTPARCPETQNGLQCVLAAGHTVPHTTGWLADSRPAWVASPPAPRPGSRRRWILGCAGLLAIVVILGGLAAYGLSRTFGNGFAVMAASAGEIDSFHAFTNGSRTTITFQAARGLDLPDGPRLACEVVRPAIAKTDWANAGWTIVNRAGDLIASDETPCP